VRAWLRRGAAAASIASQRPDLWPAAALAWLAYVGWLPFLLAVAPPQPDEVASLAIRMYTSSAYPANVVALAVAVVGGFMLLCLVAAVGETAVTRALRAPGDPPAGADAPDAGHAALAGLALLLAASLPVVLAFGWLLIAAMSSAPAVYTTPGPEASVIPRLAAVLAPQLAVLGGALLVSQMIGGRLLRAAIRSPGTELGASLAAALGDLRRRPAPWLGIAAAGLAKDAALVVGSWALLAILWERAGGQLGPGLLDRPQALLLLVGFVAIWLVLLLVGGALHAFISAWWLLEDREGR
jgi:hypothetical protein